MALTRNVPLQRGKCAILVIDMQTYCAVAGKGLHAKTPTDLEQMSAHDKFFFSRLHSTVIPAIQGMLTPCRLRGVDVIYTYIECLTEDGRDQSLDYKLSGFLVPKGSEGATILREVAPTEDEILIPKTSCSVFNSTNIEYVLRNLGVSQLVVTGIRTNQCVESAVRDAADRGFYVTVAEDACSAAPSEAHDMSLQNMKGFARIVPHTQVVQEIMSWSVEESEK